MQDSFIGGSSDSLSEAPASLCALSIAFPDEAIVFKRNLWMTLAAATLTTFPRTYSSQAFLQDIMSSADFATFLVVFFVSL